MDNKKMFNPFKLSGCNLKPLSNFFNLLILLLIVALIVVIMKELYMLFSYHLWFSPVKPIMSSILFVFILIELFTILYMYLKTEFVKVERIVEVGIIAIVRDVFIYATDMEVGRIYSLSVVLAVFGLLFFIEKHFSKDRNRDNI